MLASSPLLVFYKRPSEPLGVITQLHTSLGGKTILIDIMVVEDPMDLYMLLGHDYVYAMNILVSLLFRVIHFPHNGSIVTIDQLDYIPLSISSI